MGRHVLAGSTIFAAAAAAATEGPPGLPPVWTGVPTANYTMPGYDGGTLDIRFYSDCSRGAALQRMKTVYPDTYTVITYCDRGWSYLLQPKGPGPHTCDVWPVAPGTCEVSRPPAPTLRLRLRRTRALTASRSPPRSAPVPSASTAARTAAGARRAAAPSRGARAHR